MYRNHEGYSDPTAGIAIARVSREEKKGKMTDGKAKEYYEKFGTYTAQPITEKPLLGRISAEALIAWFRCNSCTSCRWRKEVIDEDRDENHDIHFCSRMHEKHNIVDMVSYLGYQREGQENWHSPRFKEDV